MKNRKIIFRSLLLLLTVNWLLPSDHCFSQTPIPKITATKGKEFWFGFLENCTDCSGQKRLDVFVTSDKNTSGTLTIPGQSYTQNFSVTANQTTTINIPNTTLAEHLSTETIDNKGIYIETLDTVAVYAINFQDYTSDGTLVLPIGSLGSDYRITSYKGLSGYALYSNALIVATEDGTQVEIIPSVNTLGGKTAGSSYIINLNAGQSYQLKAASTGTELTGTIIRGTLQNGTCRPFAVFSGSMCTNIPVGCTACDHIYEQEYPTNIWGKNYLIAPFSFASSYTYKVLANTSGTSFSINGGPSQNLNAGQMYEANYVTGAVYITSNNKISVTQFMQGASCSNDGDPAQLFLNPMDQVLSDVTFSTVTSSVITQHKVNVIMKTAFTSQLLLDGIPINPSQFTAFTANPTYSYAQLTINQGSHTMHADSGFTAYAYGIGGYETYAYALGSFNEETIIPTDTVYCTDSSITLTPPETILFPEWSTVTYPDSIIGTGQTLTVTPAGSEIYIVNGISQLTGCPFAYKFSVETPNPPNITYTISADSICKFETVNFNLNVTPYSSTYLYSWTPTIGLDDPFIANPVATPLQSMWYHVTVSTFSGCGSKTDSIYVFVRPGGNVSNVEVTADKTLFCLGDSSQLNLLIENIVFEDSINPDYNSALWSSVTGGSASSACGSGSGNAIYFNSAGSRWAATASINTVNGGTLYFALKIANGTAPCEGAEPGEDVVLEYSNNGGLSWTIFKTYYENQYPVFTSLNIPIPLAAQTAGTRFRWRQLTNSGAGQDNWALDDIYIGIKNNSNSTFVWSPVTGLSDTSITDPMSYPSSAITYYISVTDTGSGCNYTDSVFINVGQPFTLNVSNDDTICQVSGTPFFANPSIPGTYTFAWTPGATLSDDSISNPVATPTSTTTYYVNAESIQGCSASDSVKIYVPAISQFYSTPEADSLCAGDSVQITTIYQKGCGTNGSACGGPVDTSQVGTAATTTSTNNATLFNGNSLSSRFQLLFTKAELNAAGISQASTINEIGFRIGSVAGSNIYQNFTIKMGCTNLTALTTSFVANMAVVFTPKNVVISSNIIYYPFDNTFDWDGSSNLIVEVCYSNAVTSANSSTYYSASGFNSFLAASSSSACNAATGTLSANKPNTYFKFCGAPPLNGLTFSWSPASGLDDASVPNPLASPLSPTVYFVSATDSATGCIYTDSIRVSVGPVFTLTSPDTLVTCNTQGVQISAVPSAGGNYSYNWSPAATLSSSSVSSPLATPGSTTQYNVSVTSESGCTVEDSVTVVVPALATFFATPGADTICAGQQVQINTVFQKGCGVNGSICSGSSVSVQLGTSATTSSATGITVYKGSVNSSRIQFLYKKSELNAAGINTASTLSSLGFNIATITGSNIYQNFTIKMGCTSLASLTTSFEPGLQTVFNPKNIVLSSGVNYYNFDMNFDWDGISDILVEICFNNSVTSANSSVSYSATSFNSVVYTTGASVCGSLTGTTSSSRANTYFNYCAAGAGAGLSVQWTPAIGLSSDTIPNPIASPANSTLYTVIATDTSTGCVFSDSVFIQTDTSAVLSIGNDTSLCSGDTITLNAGSGFQSYLWNDNSTNPTRTISASGIYWVEAVSACGTQRDSVQVTFNGSPANLNLGPDTIICNGAQVEFNVYDSTYISYVWGDNSTDSAISVSNAGTYYVTVVNPCGTATDSVLVSIQYPVPVTLGNDSVLCSGNPVFLDAGNNYTAYLWQDGSTAQTYTAVNSGTYSVSVTGACGISSDTVMLSFTPLPSANIGIDTMAICSGDSSLVFTPGCANCIFSWSDGSSDSSNYISTGGIHSVAVSNECGSAGDSLLVLIQYPVPVDLGSDTALCSGLSYTLNAGADYSGYLWQDGSSAQTFDVANSGTYSVSVTSACGNSSDTVQVTLFPLPVADIPDDSTIICNGDSVTAFISGCIGCSYSWDNGSADTIAIFTAAGFHYVVVMNQCGNAVDSIFINLENSTPVNLGNDAALCSGDTLTLDAGSGYSSYLWQDGSSSQAFVVQSAGMYHVTVTNSCGTFSDTVSVNYDYPPVISLGNDTAICPGDSILLSVNNCSNCSYYWQDGSADPFYLVTQDGSYFVNVNNQCGLTSDVINIFANPLPEVFLGNDTAFCGTGNPIVLNAFNPSSSYFWSNGSTASSLSVTAGGTYWVQVSNECGTTGDTILISITPVPAVDLGDDAFICNGNSLLLTAGTSSGMQYQWQDSSANSTFLVTSGGLYWVSAGNSCGSDTDSILITEGSSPVIDLGDDISFCLGNSAILSAGGGNYQYLWSNGTAGSVLQVDSTGTYWVQATNSCGTVSDTVDVAVNPLPVVELGKDSALCIGDTVKLDVTQPGCTYLWQNNSTGPVFYIVSDGNYWVNVTTAYGCRSSDTISIFTGAKPLFTLGEDTAICPDNEVWLDISSYSYQFEWHDGSAGTTFLARDSGLYYAKATNICGSYTDSIYIGEIDCECHVDVPSAFSPNNDGANDILYLRGNCVIEIDFYIYDRWGQLVFESHDLSNGWDGTLKGKKMDTAVFVYYLTARSYYNSETEFLKKGNISLIR